MRSVICLGCGCMDYYAEEETGSLTYCLSISHTCSSSSSLCIDTMQAKEHQSAIIIPLHIHSIAPVRSVCVFLCTWEKLGVGTYEANK